MADHIKQVCQVHAVVVTQCRCPGERLSDGSFAPKAIVKVPCNDWCPNYEGVKRYGSR